MTIQTDLFFFSVPIMKNQDTQTTRLYFNKVMRLAAPERAFLAVNFNWIYPASVTSLVNDFRLLMSRLQDMSNKVGKVGALRYVGLHTNPERGVNQVFESLSFQGEKIVLSITEIDKESADDITGAIADDSLEGTPQSVINYLNDSFLKEGSVYGNMALPNGVFAPEFVYTLCEFLQANIRTVSVVNMQVEFGAEGTGRFALTLCAKECVSHAMQVTWVL